MTKEEKEIAIITHIHASLFLLSAKTRASASSDPSASFASALASAAASTEFTASTAGLVL